MQVDASLRAQVADVRQFQITLTPTARATNQLQLTGKIDMSQTNAIQGAIKLAADSLDVTSYYDLFAKKTAEKARAPAAPEPAPATTPSETDQEPAAMQLPFHNFTVELSLRRLWLREIEVADLQAVAKRSEERRVGKECRS